MKAIRNYVISNIDWTCEIITLFRDVNKGCGYHIADAVTWFFSKEVNGIILEDDCVPHASFFSYCEEMLNRYKGNPHISHINGTNPLLQSNVEESYFFSNIMNCWGWATWADRWQKHFQFDLTLYNEKNIEKFSPRINVQTYWKNILHITRNNLNDTWDYQWLFGLLKGETLCITPKKNLISNIGINGVHADDDSSNPNLNRPVYDFYKTPVIHPKKVINNIEISERIQDIYLESDKKPKISFKRKLKLWRRSIIEIKLSKKNKIVRILGICFINQKINS